MKILANYPGNDLIASATTDDGAVTYSPIGNDRLIDNNTSRDMWRGTYPDADGYHRHDRVPAATWAGACALMRTVDDHNNRIREDMRRRAEQRQIDRIQDWQVDLAADMDRADSDK